MTALLEVDSVDVRFGGLQALRGVNLVVESGAVTGLIGPNGAGKTTLFNVICGYQPPTQGTVHLNGANVSHHKPHQRSRNGIARTFQRLETFGSLTARDNILVAAEVRRQWARDGSDPRSVTEEIIDFVGLRSSADEQVDAMPTGLARLVELGRALAIKPSVLLLDEPSSGLDERESDDFGRLLIRLAESGIGVLLVEHDIDLVMSVCSKIFVLDFGSILAVGTPSEIQTNPAVRAAYLGAGDEAASVIASA